MQPLLLPYRHHTRSILTPLMLLTLLLKVQSGSLLRHHRVILFQKPFKNGVRDEELDNTFGRSVERLDEVDYRQKRGRQIRRPTTMSGTITPERIMNTRMRMRKVVRYWRSSGRTFALPYKEQGKHHSEQLNTSSIRSTPHMSLNPDAVNK